MPAPVTFALPSKGAIAEPTYNFLEDCGLKVRKLNPRQYTGTMRGLPEVNVLFQRVKDVLYKVADGTAHLGITGFDVIQEHPHDDLIVIHDQLGYGHCQLVVAVPEGWIDVENMADLADVAADFREHKGRNLRIATTYTSLTRQFLHTSGIHHFTLVKAEGAIEAAPTIGYADIIVDLTQTGTTLRENHLRPLPDGTILESQASLIGNRRALRENQHSLQTLRTILEYIDASLSGKGFSQVTVNIQGKDAESIAAQVASNPTTRGLLGPTIAPIYSANGNAQNGQWHTVTITVKISAVLEAVDFLRSIGATQMITTPVNYIFQRESATYADLLRRLTE